MRLRRKLGEPPLIETVIGGGYHCMRITPAALRPWRSSIRARMAVACAAVLVPGAILIGAAYTQVGASG
jgi:hypothetical protein